MPNQPTFDFAERVSPALAQAPGSDWELPDYAKFIRPGYDDLVASGLPKPVAWRLLRGKRATRLSNYLRRRRQAIKDSKHSPNTKLSGGGPLSNKTTEAESRRPLE